MWKQPVLAAVLLAGLVGTVLHGASAKVTRLEIAAKPPNGSFLAGDYVRWEGRIRGEFSPSAEAIPDLDKSPRNASGMVLGHGADPPSFSDPAGQQRFVEGVGFAIVRDAADVLPHDAADGAGTPSRKPTRRLRLGEARARGGHADADGGSGQALATGDFDYAGGGLWGISATNLINGAAEPR